MKELNRKVFITIFSILSLFVFIGISIYNLQSYKKEYDGLYRNLNFINDFKVPKNNDIVRPKEIDNMMFMEYEVYTIILEQDEVSKIIGHSNNNSKFDVQRALHQIIKNGQGLKTGNLYFSSYSYNWSGDTVVIINNKDINNRLVLTLLESLLVLATMEIIIYFVTHFLTKKITYPAEESFNKQKEFIADASHELKTPLAVILASSDELKSDKKNSKYIENIKYESERMNKLIKELLDLSKLEDGVSIKNYKEENLSKIIEKISLTFEGIAFENNINIETNIDENIMFNCSKEEIEKLISILLDNAIKHSYKESTIKVNTIKEKNSIAIEVSNVGDPISPGDEEKIFERFYRSDKSRNRDSNRYGLGLAIAKNIVINHGGSIKAYSKDNKTTFKIVFK